MYVPNYIPEPLEVPGNITLAPYIARVRFIRRVVYLHLASLAVVALLVLCPLPSPGVQASALGAILLFLALDLVRIRYRGQSTEAVISSTALPLVLVAISVTCKDLLHLGVPLWAVLAGPAFVGLYTSFCGRDFSFVGCGFISWIGSCTAVAAYATYAHLSVRQGAVALLLSSAYLGYVVYDLACLLARRREDEALAAVVDLYRDVFNIFGYLVRIIGHWKKHKIWAVPK